MTAAPPPTSAAAVKACCAATYEDDLVALLLGPSFHPGGLRLTRHLAAAAALGPDDRVLDLASGPGATALLLAAERGSAVHGLDLGAESVRRAAAAASERGLGDRVRFLRGDAEHLPYADGSFDAVVTECAYCTFPDKARVAAEIARVLRPGGRLAMTDVLVDVEHLDPALRSLAAWVACIADARSLDGYAAALRAAGLRVTRVERHDHTLREMIDQIAARLAVLRMARLPAVAGVDQGAIDAGLARARGAVQDGTLGYGLLVAEKPPA